MSYHPANYYQTQRLMQISDYVRSMGRKCYIDGNKLAVEIEKQTNNGSVYTVTEFVTTKAEAERIICDE